MSKIYPVIWKELKSMIRDVRTLLIISILPLTIMPLMSTSSLYLQRYQQGVVVIVDEDMSEAFIGYYRISSSELASRISAALEEGNFIVKEFKTLEEVKGMYYDLGIVIPKNFVENASSLTKVAYIRIIRTVGSAKTYDAERIARDVIGFYSRYIAQVKTYYIANISGLSINVESVLNPVKTVIDIVGPGGIAASPTEELRSYLARILTFSLIFVTTPSIAYITDSIIGEKERKTFEAVLATPLPRHSLLIGKVLSTSIIGLIVSVSDALGLILFFALPSLAYGVNILTYLTSDLVIIHIVGVYTSVLASLALILPVIIRASSYRSSQAMSLAIISIASVVFFMCLYVDIPNLSVPIRYLLYILPYTHIVVMIRYVVLGTPINAVMHLGVAIAETIALLLLSVKIFDDERVIYSKT